MCFKSRIQRNLFVGVCQEKELDKMFGKIGKNEAYWKLKNKINSAIVEKYSWTHYDTFETY
jgi:hypothetical protein